VPPYRSPCLPDAYTVLQLPIPRKRMHRLVHARTRWAVYPLHILPCCGFPIPPLLPCRHLCFPPQRPHLCVGRITTHPAFQRLMLYDGPVIPPPSPTLLARPPCFQSLRGGRRREQCLDLSCLWAGCCTDCKMVICAPLICAYDLFCYIYISVVCVQPNAPRAF